MFRFQFLKVFHGWFYFSSVFYSGITYSHKQMEGEIQNINFSFNYLKQNFNFLIQMSNECGSFEILAILEHRFMMHLTDNETI